MIVWSSSIPTIQPVPEGLGVSTNFVVTGGGWFSVSPWQEYRKYAMKGKTMIGNMYVRKFILFFKYFTLNKF